MQIERTPITLVVFDSQFEQSPLDEVDFAHVANRQIRMLEDVNIKILHL